MGKVTAVLFMALLVGCSSARRDGDEVRLTRNLADIEHCKPIGAVQTLPPYAVPGDDVRQIRAKTVAIGADTVLLNGTRAGMTGVAYRCRTPAPI